MKTKIVLLLLVFAILSCFTTACDDELEYRGSISGIVTDRDTGETLQNVEVWTSPSTHTFTTGYDGTFEFLKLDGRQYEVWAQKSGYYPNHKTITTIAGSNVFVELALQKKP